MLYIYIYICILRRWYRREIIKDIMLQSLHYLFQRAPFRCEAVKYGNESWWQKAGDHNFQTLRRFLGIGTVFSFSLHLLSCLQKQALRSNENA